MEATDIAYKRLAEAVCLQAVIDYVKARRFLDTGQVNRYKDPVQGRCKERQHRNNLESTVRFFRSDDFNNLSGLDGRQVYEKLKDRCDKDDYRINPKFEE